MQNRPMMLTESDVKNCKVQYHVNRYEVYHADGWMLFAAGTKQILRSMISMHQIQNPEFVGLAATRYLEENEFAHG